jgi:hypothetical protein
MLNRATLLTFSLAALIAPALAAADAAKTPKTTKATKTAATCPAPVSDAVQKAYPSSKVTACKQETEHGKVQYEVKLETKEAKKLELDITPEGSVIQTEESVAVAAVPKAVTSAFDAKYPKMKPTQAAKQTKADGTIAYELAWKDAKGRHEATFKEDGSFLEEE